MSDHRILSAYVSLSLRASSYKLYKRRFYDWSELENHEKITMFQKNIEDALQANMPSESTANAKYDYITTAIKYACDNTIATKQRKQKKRSWVSANTENLMTERNLARKQYRKIKSVENKNNLDTLNEKLYSALKEDKENQINAICTEIEDLQAKGNIKGLYGKINQLTGHKTKKKEIRIQDKDINSKAELLNIWKTYFESLLKISSTNSLYPDIPEPDHELPINQADFTELELQYTLKQLKKGKSPGLDDISIEALKFGGDTLMSHLLELCNRALDTGEIPDRWREGLIIPIPKKGNQKKIENYRGITLLSTPLKLYNKMLLNRIEPHVTPLLRVNQAGFLKGRGTIEQIHCLRRLLEGVMDKHIPTVLTFIDFTKAFDSINREYMFKILENYGIPKKIVNAIKSPYMNTTAKVLVNGQITDSFHISSGILQGDVLSPYLFLLCIDYIFKTIPQNFGITTDKVPLGIQISDLSFADDVVLLDDNVVNAQMHIDALVQTAGKIGLTINTKKSKVMMNEVTGTLHCINQPLETVQDFQYLGSFIKETQTDIRKRKQKALIYHKKLQNLWSNNLISLATKLRLYKTTSRAIFLYGSQTWNISTKESISSINSFETTCLRTIMGYTWRDHISNDQVLAETNQKPLIQIVQQNQLKWLGHNLRHPPSPIFANLALYRPSIGKRRRGRPRRQYWQYIGQILETIAADSREYYPEDILEAALDRDIWHTYVHNI